VTEPGGGAADEPEAPTAAAADANAPDQPGAEREDEK
jgi:hypothetical protein